ETTEDMASNATRGIPAMGIGEGTIVEGAIVDKNVRIGRRARIVNDHGWEDTGDSDRFTVRDRIAVVPKDAVVPDGWIPDPTHDSA
ncbi:MAG: glucose-1-phosphate adenylyltransferase, partial [Planctomycetia bacterium]|nr:glucose-1-phosphate adenylyltransferase [Planctomycetia bacterium]